MRSKSAVVFGILTLLVGTLPTSMSAVTPAPPAPVSDDALVAALRGISGDRSVPPAENALRAAEVVLSRSDLSRVDDALLPMLDQERRNVQTARDILAALDAPDDTLTRGLAVAQVATRWQLETLGVSTPVAAPVQGHASLVEAIRALALRQPGAAAPDAEALTRLGALSEEAQAALLRTIDAFVALHDSAAAGYAASGLARLPLIDPSRVTTQGTLDVDTDRALTPDQLVVAFGAALVARERFLATLPDLHAALIPHAAADTCEPLVVPSVLALDTEGCDATYADPVALSIDVAGDDVYENNAGGFPALACAYPVPPSAGAAALVDFDGNDIYRNATGAIGTFPGVLCGANGGAYAGAGVLVDAAGDDLYSRVSFASNGAGFRGAGFLLDAGGANSYRGGTAYANGGGSGGMGALLDLGVAPTTYVGGGNSINGGACYGGAGLLVDAGGPDTYVTAGGCGSNGQAGGAVPASGFLLDAGEDNDTYFGRNGAGGIATGFLFDEGGDDLYQGEPLGASQGGTWLGVGMLIDAAGSDDYRGGHLGANGGAQAGGAGHLLDLDGDDVYSAGSLATNGGAADEGLGFLFDARGDDLYTALSIATNGGGFFGGRGSLLDLAGDDAYRAGRNGVNGGGAYNYPGVGSLVDLGGYDVYEDEDGGTGDDRTVAPKGAGLQLDLEVGA